MESQKRTAKACAQKIAFPTGNDCSKRSHVSECKPCFQTCTQGLPAASLSSSSSSPPHPSSSCSSSSASGHVHATHASAQDYCKFCTMPQLMLLMNGPGKLTLRIESPRLPPQHLGFPPRHLKPLPAGVPRQSGFFLLQFGSEE